MELEDAHGYVESRRGRSSTTRRVGHERKALRDTQIKSIHEMGEMKKAQELRVDEFSV